MKQTPKASMTLRLPVDLFERLVNKANDQERSTNFIVLEALEQTLPRGENQQHKPKETSDVSAIQTQPNEDIPEQPPTPPPTKTRMYFRSSLNN